MCAVSEASTLTHPSPPSAAKDPPFDPVSFAKGVTYDASSDGGSAPACTDNVRAGFKLMLEMGHNEAGEGGEA